MTRRALLRLLGLAALAPAKPLPLPEPIKPVPPLPVATDGDAPWEIVRWVMRGPGGRSGDTWLVSPNEVPAAARAPLPVRPDDPDMRVWAVARHRQTGEVRCNGVRLTGAARSPEGQTTAGLVLNTWVHQMNHPELASA